MGAYTTLGEMVCRECLGLGRVFNSARDVYDTCFECQGDKMVYPVVWSHEQQRLVTVPVGMKNWKPWMAL